MTVTNAWIWINDMSLLQDLCGKHISLILVEIGKAAITTSKSKTESNNLNLLCVDVRLLWPILLRTSNYYKSDVAFDHKPANTESAIEEQPYPFSPQLQTTLQWLPPSPLSELSTELLYDTFSTLLHCCLLYVFFHMQVYLIFLVSHPLSPYFYFLLPYFSFN